MNRIGNILLRFLFAGLILWFLFELLLLSCRGLWFDELDWGLAFLDGRTFPEAMRDLVRSGTTPPGFLLVLYPFFRLFPHNAFLLRLPFILLTCGGFFLLLRTILRNTEPEYRKNMAVLSLILFASIPGILRLCVQIRPYPLLFFGASLFLYADDLCREKPDKRNLCLAGSAMFLMFLTHYTAFLYAGYFFFRDLTDILRKKKTWKSLAVTVIPGILVLPWLMLVFLNRTGHASSLWFTPPSVSTLFLEFPALSGGLLSGSLLMIGIIFALYHAKKSLFLRDAVLSFLWLFLLLWSLNRFGGLPLFLPRYLMASVPALLILPLFGMCLPVFRLPWKQSIVFPTMLIIGCSFLVLGGTSVFNIAKFPHYREFLPYLSDGDLQREDAVLLCYGEEWLRHYRPAFDKMPCNVWSNIRLSFDGQWRASFPDDNRLSEASRTKLKELRKTEKKRWKAPYFSQIVRNGEYVSEQLKGPDELFKKRFVFVVDDQGPLNPATEEFLKKNFMVIRQRGIFRKLERKVLQGKTIYLTPAL